MLTAGERGVLARRAHHSTRSGAAWLGQADKALAELIADIRITHPAARSIAEAIRQAKIATAQLEELLERIPEPAPEPEPSAQLELIKEEPCTE